MTITTPTARSYRRGRRPQFRHYDTYWSAFSAPAPLTDAAIVSAVSLADTWHDSLTSRGAHWDSTGPTTMPVSAAEARAGIREVHAAIESLAGVAPHWSARATDRDRQACVTISRLQLIEDILRSWLEESTLTLPHGTAFYRARALRSAMRTAALIAAMQARRRPRREALLPATSHARTLTLAPRAPGSPRLCVA